MALKIYPSIIPFWVYIATSNTAKRGGKMFKILVVEDDKNLRKLITTYLRKNEYITYEATNGEEALEVIDTNYIDLIISW